MSAIERISASAQAGKRAGKRRISIGELMLRAVHRWQRARAINELSRLDDRDLEDIGLSRNDIPRVVEGLMSAKEAEPEPLPRVVYRGEGSVIAADEPYREAA